MAGFGEASAIVGLIATAARLSKAVIDIAGKYKDARKQIESFGHEVAILGNILDQMYRLLGRDHLERDIEVYSVMLTIVNQCSEFFSELDFYKDTLYSRQNSTRSITFRGKSKWVFEAAPLEYLRARLESMKTNMLLMMTMQCMHSYDRLEPCQATQENARQIQLLALQSDACVRRLETLEEAIPIPASSHGHPADNRMSIMTTDTAVTARSTRESIMSLYGHQSYYEIILDPREGKFDMAPTMPVDHARISMIIEDHLDPGTTQSPDLSGHGDQDAFNKELVLSAGNSTKFFDNGIVTADGTETLWDTVLKHKESQRSTPSERSLPSTILTRASNVIRIDYIPGVTNRAVESTSDTLTTVVKYIPDTMATIIDKPLPPLPLHCPVMQK